LVYFEIIFAIIFFEDNAYGVVDHFRGTFSNNNYYANFLCIAGLIIYFEILSKRYFGNKYSPNFLYFSLAIITASIMLSGIRTSFITFLIGILVSLLTLVKLKRMFNVFIISLLIMVSIGIISSNFQIRSIDRLREGLNNLYLGFSKSQETNTTLDLTINTLHLINSNDILFGRGRLFKSGYFVTKSGKADFALSRENKNFTDATMALIIVEFGIIGTFLFFFPVVFIIKNVNSMKIEIKILLFILILQTITDIGVFGFATLGLSLLYVHTGNSRNPVLSKIN